jgi:hypothetical protein
VRFSVKIEVMSARHNFSVATPGFYPVWLFASAARKKWEDGGRRVAI